MSTLACSGQSSSPANAGAVEVSKHSEERMMENAMRETRFGAGNWFLRQDSEESRATAGRGVQRPLAGRVPVPAGLALAMAMSIKTGAMKMRERSLSGITLVDEERNAMRPVVPSKPKWLSLC